MIVLTENNLPKRLSIQMILREVLRRGWTAQALMPNDPHAILTRPDGKVLHIYSSSPPTMSYAAAHVANDKFLTHKALEAAQLPLLQTFQCQTDDEAEQAVRMLTEGGDKYVVKPLDAGHANGVTVGLQSLTELQPALAFARQYSSKTIIQQYVPEPIDARILCIDYKVVAALERIPARVIGDAVHTIAQLIDLENDKRGAQYTADLSKIPKDRAAAYLGDRMHNIPAEHEVVTVLGAANIGMGGEAHDITDQVPDWLVATAEKAARTLQLPVCGVDFLLLKLPQTDMSFTELQPTITEVNKCPALFMHEHPMHGPSRPVVKAYVDYLAHI